MIRLIANYVRRSVSSLLLTGLLLLSGPLLAETTPLWLQQLAGEKQIAKLSPGQFYMDDSGVWQSK